MKKILFILAVLAVAISFTACDDALHNGTQVFITGVKVINIPASYNGKTLYVHEGWMPGNTWDDATPNQAVCAGGELEVTFGTPAIVTDADFGVQVIAVHWGDKVVAGLDPNVTNPYDSGTYVVEVDASTSKAVLK